MNTDNSTTNDPARQTPNPKQSSLLIDQSPILFYPALAKLIGVNQAIMLQQLHFLMNSARTAKNKYVFVDERWWVYNSYEEWQTEQFTWLSQITIKRLFIEMENAGFILSMQSVKNPSDRRKWYSIDYEAWELFVSQNLPESSDAPYQNDTVNHRIKMIRSTTVSKRDDGYSEITTEREREEQPPPSRANYTDPAFSERYLYYRAFEQGYPPEARPKIEDTKKNRQVAQFLYANGYQVLDVIQLVQSKIEAGSVDYRFVYLQEDMPKQRLIELREGRKPTQSLPPNERPGDHLFEHTKLVEATWEEVYGEPRPAEYST